jgi:hypothetical protein
MRIFLFNLLKFHGVKKRARFYSFCEKKASKLNIKIFRSAIFLIGQTPHLAGKTGSESRKNI